MGEDHDHCEIPSMQAQQYREYRNGLGKYTPATLHRRAYPRLRENLHSAGIPGPTDWHPTDKAEFYRVIEERATNAARKRVNKPMHQNLGFYARQGPARPTISSFAAIKFNGSGGTQSRLIVLQSPFCRICQQMHSREPSIHPWCMR